MLKKFRTYYAEKKNIRKKKSLVKKVTLTNEQISDVDTLWKKYYGKNISKDWHKLYMSYTGKFDSYYFPEILFTTNLLDKLNPSNRKKYLADKILIPYFFKDLEFEKYKVIKNHIYNCNGFFYDENGITSYENAVNKVKNAGEIIIKPSIDTNSGKNVNLFNIKDGIDIISNTSIEDIFKEYNQNFMIQEKIVQHEKFAKLNSSSVNTIRINTYICNEKVYNSPISMRIGRAGSIVDNAHAGGIQVGVNQDGTLKKYAFTEYGKKYEVHPDTNVKFEGYKLPRISEMIEFAKKYHYKIPHMGIIAWDFTLDENENIVIVEANINCPTIWFPQYTNGEAFFGENTISMIEMLKEKGR